MDEGKWEGWVSSSWVFLFGGRDKYSTDMRRRRRRSIKGVVKVSKSKSKEGMNEMERKEKGV